MTTVPERRRTPRAPFGGKVAARVDGTVVSCVGGDLCESGMLLYPRRARTVFGQPLRLTFTLPRCSKPITVEAWLKRCQLVGGRVAWAVEFLAPPQIRRKIRTFVFVGHGAVRDYDERECNEQVELLA